MNKHHNVIEGKIAAKGWLTKEFDVAGLTVRVVTMLLESALVEQLQTECTREVLRMPLAPHGSHTFTYTHKDVT